MLHRGYQSLQLLRFCADALGTQIGVTGNWTIQERLLLTMCCICHRQALVASLGLSRRHIEHKVRILDAITWLSIVVNSAILSRAIANSTDLRKMGECESVNQFGIYLTICTHIQMFIGHLHLTAHRRGLAVINAVSVSILNINLGAVAFPTGFQEVQEIQEINDLTALFSSAQLATARCPITHRFSRITPFVSRTINACSQN